MGIPRSPCRGRPERVLCTIMGTYGQHGSETCRHEANLALIFKLSFFVRYAGNIAALGHCTHNGHFPRVSFKGGFVRLQERDWELLTQLDRFKRAIEQLPSEARCTPASTTAPGACTPRVQRVRWGMAKTPGGTLPRCWRKSAVCFSSPQGGRIASSKATSGSMGVAAEPGGAGRVVTVVGGRGERGDPDSGHGNKGKGEYHVSQA